MQPSTLSQSILLVEDSPEDYEATARTFQKAGLQNPVFHCGDGDEALDFLHRRGTYSDPIQTPRPSIILLELNLPGTDGREVLADIKQDAVLKQIPVIVLTTSSDERDIGDCYAAGANSYMLKPVNLERFIQAVQRLEGTSFTLRLPTREHRFASTQEPNQSEAFQHNRISSETVTPAGSGRVLFVDDEEALTFAAEQMLNSLGYEGVVTTSSMDALELFRRDPYAFDAVITDQTMPYLTGEGLARELLGMRPDLPMIVCTGFSQTFTLDKAKALGVCDYLLKPLSKQELGQSLERALAGNIQGLPSGGVGEGERRWM